MSLTPIRCRGCGAGADTPFDGDRCQTCRATPRRAGAIAKRTGLTCRCGAPLSPDAPYSRFCDACRAQVRKKPARYPLTPEREAYLRAHYQPHVKGISARVAAVLRVPAWRVKRWAAELGLAVTGVRAPAWSAAEVAFLEEHVGARTVGWIAKRLGRTVTAVSVKAKRLHIDRRGCREWYTADALAIAMGVDATTIGRWIRQGWLQATAYGQVRPDGRPAAFAITPLAVRRFLQQHPGAYTLAKVDQVWFLDLAFGAVGTAIPSKAEPEEARIA